MSSQPTPLVWIALMCCAPPTVRAQDVPQPWSEPQVIERFLAQSPQSRELRARVALTEAEARTRAVYSNPSVAYAREGAGYNEFIEASQILPVNGRIRYLREAGAAAVSVAEANREATLWSLRSDVRVAFYRMIASQDRLRILSTGTHEVEQLIRILRQREDEGEGSVMIGYAPNAKPRSYGRHYDVPVPDRSGGRPAGRLSPRRHAGPIYDATRSADGTEAGMRRFLVRAPISGISSESSAVSSANVELGKVLFRVVETNSLYVSGVVPESEFSKLRQLSGAESEMPDSGQVRPANGLVAIGRLVDSETRTIPVTYEVDNRQSRPSFGGQSNGFPAPAAHARRQGRCFPEAAIIDDAGRPVVFVQKGGETFLRRPVKLGVRNSGMVQVLEGINPGDRIVTKGAYLIRLSTMSSTVPAHGHVH